MRRFGLGLIAVFAAACTTGAPEDEIFDDEDAKFDGAGTRTGTLLVLRGTVVTMDEARGTQQVLEGGAVVIEKGKIKSVLAAGEALPTGSGVTTLGGADWVIAPGLINLHNHHAYNTARIYRELPLYENTYQWRDEPYYDTHIQYPKKVLADSTIDPSELGLSGTTRIGFDSLAGRYSEVKELVSGTTSTQGSYFGGGVPTGYGQDLVRNVDWSNFGQRRVTQTALGILVGSFDPKAMIARMDRGEIDAWLVHLLEGTDQESRDEFDCLKSMGLLRKELVIIHGTALTAANLDEMGRVGAKLVASPLDNLLYYGKTPDLPRAWRAGVKVSLGTDWSPAGSKNLLAELKVVDTINRQAWSRFFSEQQLIQMVTSIPADTIGWSKFAGRIKPGLYADLAVFTKKEGKSAYRSIIDATEKEVRLVLVGGDPLYGDAAPMATLKPTDHEQLSSSCGFEKAIDITTTKSSVQGGKLTFAELRDVVADALRFDLSWFKAHWDTGRGLDDTAFQRALKKAFPRGVTPREIDPLFVCEDPTFMEEVRTDANIRTSFSGLCLDLRLWYQSGRSRMYCGTMPARPPLYTVEMHEGTVPQRPAAWCAEQDWSGELPQP